MHFGLLKAGTFGSGLFLRPRRSTSCTPFSTVALAYAVKEHPSQDNMVVRNESCRNIPSTSDGLSSLPEGEKFKGGLSILYIMTKRGIPADFNTYAGILEGCIRSKSLRNGRQVHAHMVKTGFETDVFLGHHVLKMYSKCGEIDDARQMFDEMPERNSASRNSLIVAYAQNGVSEDAWKLFREMQRDGLLADPVILTSVIKACASSASLERCRQIHAHVFHAGYETDVSVASALVDLYAKSGSIVDARQVFDKMPERDVVSWIAIIAGCTKNGCGGEALYLFREMHGTGTKMNHFIVSSVLSACANLIAVEQGEQVHAYAIKIGFDSETSVGNALVTMYAKWGTLKKAQNLFERMHKRDVVSWNAVISGYAQSGNGNKALQYFAQMRRLDMKPSYVTFASVLSASADVDALEEGKQVHADAIKNGFAYNTLVGGAIVDMYVKCGSIENARLAFDKTSKHNVVLWNVMLAGYGQSGSFETSFELFCHMQWAGIRPNEFTLPSLLNTCASEAAYEQGEQIHTHIIKSGFESNVFVGSALVDMYAKCGSMENARLVLDTMPERNMVSWTALIAGYAQFEQGEEALQLFEEMQLAGMKQDHITFASALSACASLEALRQGSQIHGHLIKVGFNSDVTVGNSLVSMYAKCGSIGDASQIFDKMSELNVVSWNAMIAGYAQGGHGEEALQLFNQMHRSGMKPNLFTFPCAVSACAILADLIQGKQVHAQIIKTGFDLAVSMRNAILTLYAKCGSIEDALKEFNGMSEKNVVSWNAMISAYAQHGHAKEALQLFEQMQREGIKPNHITFVGVLSACSHVGLVDEGCKYFYTMECEYEIPPRPEHYACMVDLLSRAGYLNQAEQFINEMPFEPDPLVWRTLLGACAVHGNLISGERAARAVMELEPQDSATYVLLSNMYAAAGRLDDAEKVRKIMKDKGVRKEPGRSWVEVKNKVHAFFAGDRLHPETKEIFAMLDRLTKEMQAIGYVPENKFVLYDTDLEQKNSALNYHSEMLAIAFGVINTTPGTKIRVMKNLRMCNDCHTSIKFISKIVGQEIVVRDANRFHHFRDGMCTCRDYW